jgi:3-deoxy-7-phosphoheptulonate synthase
VRVGEVEIGAPAPVVIAGPCAVESAAQTIGIAHAVRAAGADLLRGGAFKPRTSPYDFQGLGEEGLRILAEAREETGLGIVTEVLDVRQVEVVSNHADMLQVGSRSMQNFPLLKEVGRQPKPVLLKRGAAATMHEWLGAAEYIASEGNTAIVLCERGIRTPGDGEYARYTLDVTAVEAVRRVVDLPVLVDPSHATGSAGLVPRAALAGIAAGADGLLIEVIGEETERATVRCDASQAVRPAVLESIIRALPLVCEAGRRLLIEESGAVVEAPDGAA